MKMTNKINRGFTLIEMLLVMVIISVIIYAGIGYVQRRTEQMRIDKMSLQMQQILNAGMAYYVDHGTWPTKMADLQGSYLPAVPVPFNNPWLQPYQLSVSTLNVNNPGFPATTSQPMFSVYAQITSTAAGIAYLQAQQVVGALPLAYTSSKTGTSTNPPDPNSPCASTAKSCYVVSSVTVPGQNLNNATAVTFAGLYKHGGCVPQPQCPYDSIGNAMTPQIFVVPVSVSGVNEPTATGGTPNVYPISSFTAYATPAPGSPPTLNPPACTGSSMAATDCTQSNPGTLATAYWRVCLQVVSERGDVAGTGSGPTAWGQWVTLLAITRCSINNEPSGSSFSVFSN